MTSTHEGQNQNDKRSTGKSSGNADVLLSAVLLRWQEVIGPSKGALH